ncbi:putative -like family protein [Neofusicoccum parvum UCRNP2]|uniref:Putative-like family protein n=1 Tax=Botryosphaeria parva (strain UCR-NP2) TaxID=1287680 RepID=R1GC71_BOTPV|nr:putative -like family protein [Neofusicoccum parvum UCRNP2]
MVKVAIAGGTGDVGRTILEVIKDNPNHEVVVLTRKSTDTVLGASAVGVDYTDVDILRRVLEEKNIHTVICALETHSEGGSKAQINLIKASAACSKTKRFIPSAFSIAYSQEAFGEDPMFKGYFAAVAELKKTDLQWTVIANGIFLDYFAISRIKSYLKPFPMVIDIENRMAAIPGDGNIPISFTYSFDMAKFVVASLDLDEWPEESRMAVGSKFKVVYDDVEKLKRSEVTALPIYAMVYDLIPKEQFHAMTAVFGLWTLLEQYWQSKA